MLTQTRFSSPDKVLLPQIRFSYPRQGSPPPDKVLLSQTRFSSPR
jgi:hypothetical protein